MRHLWDWLVLGVPAASALLACSRGRIAPGSTPIEDSGLGAIRITGDGNQGAVDMRLEVAAGDFLFSLRYSCTGPSVIPPGEVDFGDAESVEWVLGGIAAGSGYQCTLTGTDSNGDPCRGTTAVFDVVAGEVSGGSVLVTCTIPADASTAAAVTQGSVGFDASAQVVTQSPYACPGITAFSVVPSEVSGAQPVQVTLQETGTLGLAADGGPSTSNVFWTATCTTPPCGGFVPSANVATPTFYCEQPGITVTLTAKVTNYETNLVTHATADVCAGQPFTTMSATVVCESGGGQIPCALSDPAHPVNCSLDGGQVCTNVNLAPVDPDNCGGCGIVCPTSSCGHDPGSNTNGCDFQPGGPCTQLIGGVLADSAGNERCVRCDQNTSGLCDGTDAIFVTRDLEEGLITGVAPDFVPSSNSCYECLVQQECIDSTVQDFVTLDCEDLARAIDVQGCLDALNCFFGSPQAGTPGAGGTRSSATPAELAAECANDPVDGYFNCFCGSNEPTVPDCNGAPPVAANVSGGPLVGSPNGVCVSQVLEGVASVGLTANSATAGITMRMDDVTTGLGQAVSITRAAGSDLAVYACPQCFR